MAPPMAVDDATTPGYVSMANPHLHFDDVEQLEAPIANDHELSPCRPAVRRMSKASRAKGARSDTENGRRSHSVPCDQRGTVSQPREAAGRSTIAEPPPASPQSSTGSPDCSHPALR
jgi:hypothetical protein